jgi:succinate dehydrogenase/fumarate reductase flavoprotein subunit
MEVTRRDLLKKGALAAGALVAGSVALAGCSDDAAGSNGSNASGTWDQECDLVIVGEGMGGLAAGVRALENGIANVIIVETSKWPGGGSSFAVGGIHASGMGNSEEQYLQNTRYQSTSKLSVDSFLGIDPLITWLGTLDLPFNLQMAATGATQHDATSTDMQAAYMTDENGDTGVPGCINFFRTFETRFVEKGGTILHETTARKILTDNRGVIEGLLCYTRAGEPIRIGSSQVVLACGGWQSNEEMKNKYLGNEAWQVGNMGCPYNTGSGLIMAQEVGAALRGDFGHTAGLFLPALPAKNWMDDVASYESNDYSWDVHGKWWLWLTLIDALPNTSIFVNRSGKRFTDEAHPRHSFETDIDRQEHATAIGIMDGPAWDAWMKQYPGRGMDESLTIQDRFDTIVSDEVGGAYFSADTIEELADKLNATGIATYEVHKANLITTVTEYNNAAATNSGASLDPERVTWGGVPITTPPFYALPFRSAIFMTYGGVAINDRAQVLDSSQDVIAGLYATSPCAGGCMQEFYAGSIAHAGVTGMWAGDSAAAALG